VHSAAGLSGNNVDSGGADQIVYYTVISLTPGDPTVVAAAAAAVVGNAESKMLAHPDAA